MKAAIIGYGKMGREIGRILAERGHEVALTIDADNTAELDAAHLAGVDVALEFTQPETAYNNIRTCLESGTPVVSGTTGWTDRLEELKARCRQNGGAFFYASNYCLGVNLLFRLNRQLAAMVARVGGGYEVGIEEVHHTRKKDAPSGTAITLRDGILAEMTAEAHEVPITSIREGDVVGIHTVRYESQDDVLELKHTIKNRRALALGAVVAAEFLCGKRGVYSMEDLLQ